MNQGIDLLRIRGASHNNLKAINLDLPHRQMIAITGVSGSGKSSLAFDVIFAEGQRRYLESLSTYARQFLSKLERPKVDSIEGLTPTISIDQASASSNPRSTVGTVTEIYDHLRILMAIAGKPYCPNCDIPIDKMTLDQIAEDIEKNHYGEKIAILAPLVKEKKGDHKNLFETLRRRGFAKVRVDGIYYYLDEEIALNKHQRHNIELLVDRLTVKEDNSQRLRRSLSLAIELANGKVLISLDQEEKLYSTTHSCPVCGYSFPEITWRLFSFNTPLGACPTCYGLGFIMDFPETRIINPDKSVKDGAIKPLGKPNFSYAFPLISNFWRDLYDFAYYHGISLKTKWKSLSEKERELLLEGDGTFEGVKGFLRKLSMKYDWEELSRYGVPRTCPTCGGYRLNKSALSVYLQTSLGRYNIGQLSDMPISKLIEVLNSWTPPEHLREAISELWEQLMKRLEFVDKVGLGYLTLLRPISTLSGGELRRIKLAEQLGSGLSGITYVLDEPTVGLHPRDIDKLLRTLRDLVRKGNTVIIVEHELQVIQEVDYVVELGPEAGSRGGRVVEAGPVEEIREKGKGLTARYLRGELVVPTYKSNRLLEGYIEVKGITKHNLKNIDVQLPFPALIAITGVSGSGKSSLLETLFIALKEKLRGEGPVVKDYQEVKGGSNFKDVMVIDQSPIGKTPRSTVATYIGVFDHIRELFARLPEAKKWGFTKSHFSYNLPGGRCEACKGEGFVKIDMAFLPSAYVKCNVCGGRRYSSDILQVKFKNFSIADVLDLTVEEARDLFRDFRKIREKLDLMIEIGLGYLKLGQTSPTLSGGEAQRLKLVSELSSKRRRNMIYLLDEPTTGLHPHDVAKLVRSLRRLVDMGNLVVVVEHNLDLIKSADWIIDLGPEAADEGGEIIYQGPLEGLLSEERSYTGKWLKRHLQEIQGDTLSQKPLVAG